MRNDILTAIHGILAGYATDAANRTGCTAIIRPGGCTPGLAVHGFAPGSRETELLRPESLVDSVHGMLLAGGSAFGLTAADAYSRYADSADAVSVGRVLTGTGKDWTWGKYSAGPRGWLEYGFVQRPDISETGGQATRPAASTWTAASTTPCCSLWAGIWAAPGNSPTTRALPWICWPPGGTRSWTAFSVAARPSGAMATPALNRPPTSWGGMRC